MFARHRPELAEGLERSAEATPRQTPVCRDAETAVLAAEQKGNEIRIVRPEDVIVGEQRAVTREILDVGK